MKILFIIVTIIWTNQVSWAASNVENAVAAANDWQKKNQLTILNDFRDLLSLPNVSSDLAAMHRNADWIERYLAKRGFTYKRLNAGRAPYIYAEKIIDPKAPSILIYAHFDGQPVEKENWASDPWTPTVRDGLVIANGKTLAWPDAGDTLKPEWRLFARSAGDDKAPIIALMAALDALKEKHIEPSVNLKLILDGEEEVGSPTLAKILSENSSLFKADLMLFCDGPMHQSGRSQLVFGVRGSMTVDLTSYGPIRSLHSGHYGNWAPNPIEMLTHLLATLRDKEGKILVKNYYADVSPLSATEKKAISAMPRMDEALKTELKLARSEGHNARIEYQIMQPAIVIKGFQAGGVGKQSRNIILPSATASINLRLVPNQTPEKIKTLLEAHIKEQGFYIVHQEPGDELRKKHPRILNVDWRGSGYPAFRSQLDSIEAKKLSSIMTQINGNSPLLTPTMGGSLPIYLFENYVKAPIILLPIANHDNNQHGRNENIRLENLWQAIRIYAAIIAGYGT
jgi:acetylornithine deacetylase/succinyl-diaminopimelate desuccinylase-like protein